MRARLALATAAMLAGCSLAPKYVRPELPVPPSWPVGDAYLRQQEAALPSVDHRDVFRDSRLQAIIARALANNRDLRVAVANIEAARAQYRVQRADLFPQVSTGASYGYADRGGAGNVANVGGSGSSFSLDLGATAFELDVFGRIRSLTRAALDRYFATEAAARTVRLALVGDIADAWLTYAADRSLLLIAENTVASAERTVALTRARLEGGVSARTDLTQAQQILSTAEADVAEQRTALAQDSNALQLLVGAPVEAALLPLSIDEVLQVVTPLPAGVQSTVLLRRPDVVQAEYELRAANAEIGAARAELFPRITLTGLVGFASDALRTLFSGGAFNYSGSASGSYPIFRAGAGRANVQLTQAQRDASLANYERAIQIAFRETADALARAGTIAEQLRATEENARAAAETLRLAEARYRGGIDPFLNTLDAQRSTYQTQRTLVATRLVAASNRVTLYRVLGGDSTLEATADGPRLLSPAP